MSRKGFPTWKRLTLSCGCIVGVGSNVDPASVEKCAHHRMKVTAAEEPPAPTKEAWMLTKAVFTEQALATDQPYKDALKNTPHNAPIALKVAVMRAERAHVKAVLDALKAGHDVPGEVMADYPGWHKLKQEPQPASAPPVEEPPVLVIVPLDGGQTLLPI